MSCINKVKTSRSADMSAFDVASFYYTLRMEIGSSSENS
jgi:hypothetical protein